MDLSWSDLVSADPSVQATAVYLIRCLLYCSGENMHTIDHFFAERAHYFARSGVRGRVHIGNSFCLGLDNMLDMLVLAIATRGHVDGGKHL